MLPHVAAQQQEQHQLQEQPSSRRAPVHQPTLGQQGPAADVPIPPLATAAAAHPILQSAQIPEPPAEPLEAPVIYPATFQAMTEHKDHPLRMKLEWDEIIRAEAIQDAIHDRADLDDVSDFWYAQYALICKDVAGEILMDNVLERVETLQVFRKQYDIRESYQQGWRALRRLMELSPNFIMAFFYDPRNGNYTIVENPANIRGEDFVDQHDVRDFVVGIYYFFLAINPDLQSTHKGPSLKVECRNMGWSTRHSMMHFRKAVVDGIYCIPFDVRSLKFYNTGIAGAVFNTMRRALLDILLEPLGGEEWNGHAEKRIELGLTYTEGLDSIFLVPDAATAQQRTLRNLEDSLRLRFRNEERFRLKKNGKTNWEEVPPYTDDEVDAVYDARRRG